MLFGLFLSIKGFFCHIMAFFTIFYMPINRTEGNSISC